MKKTFPGYCRKSEKEIKSLWDNGVICFDANVLLNLYRYSNDTRDAILDLITKFENKIWLPHQAALEYNRNRYEVIADQEKAYNDFVNKIDQIQEDLKSTSKPPFLSEKVHISLNQIFVKVNKEVEESINKYYNYLKDDPIYDRLIKLFENKISKPFDDEKLQNIYKEGEERYQKKIPPGYEDEKNKQGERKYGDLVLWKQIIELANEKKTPIILITDERKVDWWWKIKDGRNMGPRQELIEEIKKEADVDFHMYSSEKFLSYGLSYLEERINKKALGEIKEMKRAEMEELEKIKKITLIGLKKTVAEIRKGEELNLLELKIKDLSPKINSYDRLISNVELDPQENMELQKYLYDGSINFYELLKKRDELKKQIDEILNEREAWNKRIHL